MGTVVAKQLNCMAESEVRLFTVSFAEKLDSGELLTGTPTAVEVTTANLTISNVAINTAALVILDEEIDVDIGQAVQFLASGAVDGVTTKVKVTCQTDSTPAQTFIGVVRVEGIADTD